MGRHLSSTRAAAAWAVDLWNWRVPPGTPVILTEDDETATDTVTRSEAWQLGDGTPVVKVEGRQGGYLLWRVKPKASAGDGVVGSLRDCLLELAGEPGESETIAELLARVHETVKRPVQIVMQLLGELEPEQLAGVAVGLQSLGAREDSPQERIAAALEELANLDDVDREASAVAYRTAAKARAGLDTDARGTAAEQLWKACDEWERAMPSEHVREDRRALVRASEQMARIIRQIREHANPEELFARTDIAQVVGRLVALEAAVFDGDGAKSSRAFGIEHWEQPGELVAATDELAAAHHRLIRDIANVAAAIAGVVKTPAKEWKKRGLHHHLQAVQRDLQRAVGAVSG